MFITKNFLLSGWKKIVNNMSNIAFTPCVSDENCTGLRVCYKDVDWSPMSGGFCDCEVRMLVTTTLVFIVFACADAILWVRLPFKSVVELTYFPQLGGSKL